MSKLIAITGKGGVGKTTVSALMIKQMISAGMKPVLAIDADPNSCLDAALGVQITDTVGRAREETRASADNAVNISKKELLRLKIEQGLIESNGFDLIAMGRPEGAGCYCYANNVLKDVIAEISSQYPYVVMDNEAGLENLSRRVVQKAHLMVLVSDASNAGLVTLLRLYELASEMDIRYDKLALVINKTRNNNIEPDNDIIKKIKADLVINVPSDEALASYAEENKPLLTLPDDNAAYNKLGELIKII